MQTTTLQRNRALHTALLVLLLSAMGMGKGYAYDFSAVCETGQTLYYEITDTENRYVSLSCPSPWDNNNSWYGYNKPTGNIVLPYSVENNGILYAVTSIGERAFLRCTELTGSLTIPNSVTAIGSSAFRECSGFIGRLTIPNSVTAIGDYAFGGCRGFTGNLTIPNSVTKIESSVFCSCSGFTGSLTIPNSVTAIGGGAFSDCEGFRGSLTIPNSVIEIGDSAFSGCFNITSISIPNSVTYLGSHAFHGTGWYYNNDDGIMYIDGCCLGSKGGSPPVVENCLYIREGTRLIAGGAFRGAAHVRYINMPNSLKTICDFAFAEMPDLGGTLNIPESVEYIGACAFCKNNFDGSLIIPNSVTTIGAEAFWLCTGFTSLTIGNSVIEIGVGAFSNCSGFTGDLVIPNSVTEIGDGAFSNCSGFTGDLVISNFVTSIKDDTFRYCSGFSGSLTIPESVTSIGETAFEGCTGFTGALIIPNSVTVIGFWAFVNCTGFTSLVLGNSVTSIGWSAFGDCGGFTGDLVIPNSVTSIGYGAFLGCAGFAKCYVLSETPPNAGDGSVNLGDAFDDALTYLVIPCGCGWRYSYWSCHFTTIEEDCGTQYSIIIDNISSNGGLVSVSTDLANEGEEVQITVTPNTGMSLSSLTVCNASDPSQTVPVYPMGKASSTFGFLMPPYDVEIKAVFVPGHGIGEDNAIPVSVYPNPTNGQVKIEAEGLKQVTISDMLGQVIYDGEAVGDEFEYDFSNNDPGVYLVKIGTASGIVVKKVSVTQ